ncbi:MAG: sugar phosphate isomerase/epimerase, partial [Verrucomicrobia bacterium]|nr:sugar phosphate isomerase/epimerase [Verrucomicrobiota bacterium]
MNRRHFFKMAAVGLGGLSLSAVTQNVSAKESSGKPWPFKIGCAGYTFAKYNLDDSLKMMDRVNVRYMSLKDFHLPINASDEKI